MFHTEKNCQSWQIKKTLNIKTSSQSKLLNLVHLPEHVVVCPTPPTCPNKCWIFFSCCRSILFDLAPSNPMITLVRPTSSKMVCSVSESFRLKQCRKLEAEPDEWNRGSRLKAGGERMCRLQKDKKSETSTSPIHSSIHEPCSFCLSRPISFADSFTGDQTENFATGVYKIRSLRGEIG